MLKLIATGNLGMDAKIHENNGRSAIQFSIAQNKKFKDKDGNQVEKTTWLSCGFWRDEKQSKEIAKYLKKGTQVLVEGTPEVRTYTDQSGKPAAALNVNVHSIELLGSKPEAGAQKSNESQPVQQPQAAPSSAGPDDPMYDGGDLPF